MFQSYVHHLQLSSIEIAIMDIKKVLDYLWYECLENETKRVAKLYRPKWTTFLKWNGNSQLVANTAL